MASPSPAIIDRNFSMAEDLIGLLAEPGQPNFFFDALDTALATRVGHRLLTLLYKDGDEVARVYSNMPDVYPVFGHKPMGVTPGAVWCCAASSPFSVATARRSNG